jgi:hypothetical protein
VNHLLFGFALCAALAIYPGGLAALVAALAGGAAQLITRKRRILSAWAVGLSDPTPLLLGVVLTGLVVAPMPWPDNPVAPIGISWAAGSSLGGIALSLGSLWGLQLLAAREPWRPWILWSLGIWSVGLVILALAVHEMNWSGILEARGLGAELGRVGLAAVGLASLPWALRGRPGGASVRSAAWAATAGMALLLALPQLQFAPLPVTLAAWWALVAALGVAWVVGSRWGPRTFRNFGVAVPAATLDSP